MKKEDLKVGMIIENEGWTDRKILFIGEDKYFCTSALIELSGCLRDLELWQPKAPVPELYYMWRFKSVGVLAQTSHWFVTNRYLNKQGFTTGGDCLFKIWNTANHHILTEFKPITRDGKEYNEQS